MIPQQRDGSAHQTSKREPVGREHLSISPEDSPGPEGSENHRQSGFWPYQGELVVFGTVHGKQEQVAPAFAKFLRARVIAPAGLDTDQFGTFTGDIARTLSPVEAARAKAGVAMSAAACAYGLASEASYGPLPGVGVLRHEELLLFIDASRGIEIIEGVRHLTPVPPPLTVRTSADADALLQQIDFPAQGVTVRATITGNPAGITKGITNHDHLRQALQVATATSPDGHAVIEVDLRAHHNPARRAVLTELGHRLARRLATPCPVCRCPGYGRTRTRAGLPCADCGCPTELIAADIHSCAMCNQQHAVPRPDRAAAPRWCPDCNP